jgi:hypothetical protein
MFALRDRPSHTLRAALNMASDPAWLQHVTAHTGMLQAEVSARRADSQ